METRLAIFDVDKTIIKNDSMFTFLWYGIKKRPITILNLFMVAFYSILYLLKLIDAQKAKERYFYAIKYFSEKNLEEFYRNSLEKNIYPEALKELKRRKEEGCHILLVSASPYAYIKYFGEKIPFVDGVIGTPLQKNMEFYTHKIEGLNCKGEEKVRLIKSYLKNHGIEADFAKSYAYSDSLSDLPMLSLVGNRFLINKASHSKDLIGLTWKLKKV